MNSEILKRTVISYLSNAELIIEDNYSFFYLRSEGYKETLRLKLGDGSFVMAISLFSLLSFISKLHYILLKGDEIIKNKKDIEKYKELRLKIKESGIESMNIVDKFLKKPRIGEINETEAFQSLIKNCPIDFGINKDDNEEIKKIWDKFRNNLIHMISLEGNDKMGQILIKQIIHGGTYDDCLGFLKNESLAYKSFHIPEQKTIKAFIYKEPDNFLTSEMLQQILKDNCYVDRLNRDCEKLIEWLIKSINDDVFPEKNILTAIGWLKKEIF